jgi:hypothetical protein
MDTTTAEIPGLKRGTDKVDLAKRKQIGGSWKESYQQVFSDRVGANRSLNEFLRIRGVFPATDCDDWLLLQRKLKASERPKKHDGIISAGAPRTDTYEYRQNENIYVERDTPRTDTPREQIWRQGKNELVFPVY